MALALASGLAFTFGAMRVREQQDISLFEQLFSFFLYGSLITLLLAFLIPVMGGIYWGSTHVDPGRLGLLLQFEAIGGISSAALLTGEPFGVREVLGSLLVIVAGVVEVVGNQSELE